MPLAGYFDPYFEGIHTLVQDMIAPMVGNFDKRFEGDQGYLQECHRTDQFIRAQVQWQPTSGRTVILEPI